jgi:membrane carboxypeptidase/penicillin-binding protein
VLDAHGKLLEENVPEGRQAVSAEVAYVATHMLRGTIERGTGVAAKALGRPAAAKTGTTNDYSNAWFIGYTPHLVTGVWVGYDRPRSLGKDETGSRVAVPIWTSFMTSALAGTPTEDSACPARAASSVDLIPAAIRARHHGVRRQTRSHARRAVPPALARHGPGADDRAASGPSHPSGPAPVQRPAVPPVRAQ